MIKGYLFPLLIHTVSQVLNLFNAILYCGKYPMAWRIAMLVPLHKKGDASIPSNYRGIALLSTLSKFFALMIETHLVSFQTSLKKIAAEQFGFTKNRRAQDPIFILDTLINSAIANKKALFVAFIDFEKAYDLVYRDALFFKMLRDGISGSLFRVIYSM